MINMVFYIFVIIYDGIYLYAFCINFPLPTYHIIENIFASASANTLQIFCIYNFMYYVHLI